MKFLSLIANKIGKYEEIYRIEENSTVGELLGIIAEKYKSSLCDFVEKRECGYVFGRAINVGIQKRGMGIVYMIGYLDGYETIINKGDIVFIYLAIVGG